MKEKKKRGAPKGTINNPNGKPTINPEGSKLPVTFKLSPSVIDLLDNRPEVLTKNEIVEAGILSINPMEMAEKKILSKFQDNVLKLDRKTNRKFLEVLESLLDKGLITIGERKVGEITYLKI